MLVHSRMPCTSAPHRAESFSQDSELAPLILREALVRCSLVPLEWDVAQQDKYVVSADLILSGEIIPNKSTIRINLNSDKNFKSKKKDTYILKVRRILVWTEELKTSRRRSMNSFSWTRPSGWSFAAIAWNLSETIPGKFTYSTKVTLSIDLICFERGSLVDLRHRSAKTSVKYGLKVC